MFIWSETTLERKRRGFEEELNEACCQAIEKITYQRNPESRKEVDTAHQLMATLGSAPHEILNRTMMIKNHPNFYELALLLADGQSRSNSGALCPPDRWERFIDNLSRICDQFANSISPKRIRGLPCKTSSPPS